MADRADFDILMIGQQGRIGYEALLCLASLRAHDPGFAGQVFIGEPQPGLLWTRDPRMPPDLREALTDLDAEILPFTSQHFGQAYPTGNKIEALAHLPQDRPFLFLDSDMLITAPLMTSPWDPHQPAASRRVRDTWPKPPLYGPRRGDIWNSLYRRFGIDITPTLNPAYPPDHWRHYLYRNAGWFCARSGPAFGARFAEIASSIYNDPPPELACQPLLPWLDQIALPLTLASFGGTQQGPDLDQGPLCHYRSLALLFATGSDQTIDDLWTLTRPNKLKKHLKKHRPFHRALYRGEGDDIRTLFDSTRLPAREATLRNRLRSAGLWCR